MGYYTKLQTEIIELTHCGLTVEEIADRLHLAPDEVEIILSEDHDEEIY